MSPPPATSPMSAERTEVLANFARVCRATARSVSLYPATHPSIQASLSRITAAADRLVPVGNVTLAVFPDTLVMPIRLTPNGPLCSVADDDAADLPANTRGVPGTLC